MLQWRPSAARASLFRVLEEPEVVVAPNVIVTSTFAELLFDRRYPANGFSVKPKTPASVV
jgi:hypothetical protein